MPRLGSSPAFALFLPLLSFCLPGCSEGPPRQAEQGLPAARPPQWRAADPDMAWGRWSPRALRAAASRDRPLLIYVSAPGGEGLFAGAGAAVRALVENRFAAFRIDPFRRPDLVRRYGVAGWPALVFALPDGRAFARAVDVAPQRLESLLLRLRDSYDRQRPLIERKVKQRAPREPRFEIDPARVCAAAAAAFDTLYGGWGGGVKFPEATLLRFLLSYGGAGGDPAAWEMVRRTLDALLASPMREAAGGFCLYSYTPDWQTPALEKDAADQAALLVVLLEAARRGETRYAEAARELVAYMEHQLFDAKRGAFRARQVYAEEPAAGWWTDPVIYAGRNALLISACAAAARELKDERAGRMARAAGAFVLEHLLDEQGAVFHYWAQGRARLSGLLEDQALAGLALLDLYELSGEMRFEEGARAVLGFMEAQLFDAGRRAFFDHPGAGMEARFLSYRDGALPAGNALAAELYLRLQRPERAGALLAGRRLCRAPGRMHGTCARALLHLERMRRNTP